MNKGVENSFLALLTSVLFITCSSNPTNPFERKKEVIDFYSKGDTTKLFEYYGVDRAIMNPFEEENRKILRERIIENIATLYGRELKILKIDTIQRKHSEVDWQDKKVRYHYTKCCIAYLKMDTTYIRFESYYEVDKNTRAIAFIGCNQPIDLQFLCGMDQRSTSGIELQNIVWRTKPYNNQTFISGTARIKNDTDRELRYIKFRVIFKDMKGNVFFNQTIEANTVIPVGDIVEIDIPGLKNYYAGFGIEAESFSLQSFVLEALPKPDSEDCRKLELLKTLDRK